MNELSDKITSLARNVSVKMDADLIVIAHAVDALEVENERLRAAILGTTEFDGGKVFNSWIDGTDLSSDYPILAEVHTAAKVVTDG
tara:strand:+ start:21077 stop:21334 length:258 start_codon:yes stop_codon:yes gene_type:complete